MKTTEERHKLEKALSILDEIDNVRLERKVIISNMNMLCGYMPELKTKYVNQLVENTKYFKELKTAYNNHIKTFSI